MHGTRNASHTYQNKHAVGLMLLKIRTAITHTVTTESRELGRQQNTPQVRQCSAAFICCTPPRHKQRSVRLSTLANSKDKALAPHAPSFASHRSTQILLQTACEPKCCNRRWPKIPTPQRRPARCVATPSRRRCAVRRRLASQQKRLMHASRYSFSMTLN